MAQIKQPIHLWHVPPQAAGEFGFFDALLGHGLIHPQLGAFQRGWRHGFLTSSG